MIQYLVSDYLVPVAVLTSLLGMWLTGGNPSERMRNQLGVLAALISMGFSSLAIYTINAFYVRPRPFLDHDVDLLFYQPTDSSFPSNPVAATFAIAVGVWIVNRRLGAALMVAVGFYAFARVYSGVHYPLDVITAMAIATVVAFLVSKGERLLIRRILVAVLRLGRLFCGA